MQHLILRSVLAGVGSDDMLGLILLFGLVYLIGTEFGDGAGVVAMAIAILILIVLFCRGWSSTSRAYGNWVRYWSRGDEPGRKCSTCRNRIRQTR